MNLEISPKRTSKIFRSQLVIKAKQFKSFLEEIQNENF